MENDRIDDQATLSVQEPSDLERIAVRIRELLQDDMAAEAVTRFFRLRPPDQADVMAQMPRELQAELLSWLTPGVLGEIIEELEPEEAVELSQDLETQKLSQVLDEAAPEVAADVLRGLPEEVAARALNEMREAGDVTPLLLYEDDDAGGRMSPEFITLAEGMTVAEALAYVQRLAQDLDPSDVAHIFVLDQDDVLKGEVGLGQLVLARAYQRISLIMDTHVISVPAETDQEQCARLMERYDLRNLAVVDEDGKLVGVLRLEDMINVFEGEATEDMYRMIGVGGEERALGPFLHAVRGRLPWLCLNLGTAILAGLVITLFQSTLVQAVALAAFLPVIAGQGGIAGTQTLTLIVRSLALGEISPANARRLLVKEVGLGLVHGLALGVLIGVIALVWRGSGYLALVVAVSMVLNMAVAAVSGVLVPFGLKALRIDPALASAVVVTTVTDVVGFLVYLGLAAAAIGLITGSL